MCFWLLDAKNNSPSDSSILSILVPKLVEQLTNDPVPDCSKQALYNMLTGWYGYSTAITTEVSQGAYPDDVKQHLPALVKVINSLVDKLNEVPSNHYPGDPVDIQYPLPPTPGMPVQSSGGPGQGGTTAANPPATTSSGGGDSSVWVPGKNPSSPPNDSSGGSGDGDPPPFQFKIPMGHNQDLVTLEWEALYRAVMNDIQATLESVQARLNQPGFIGQPWALTARTIVNNILNSLTLGPQPGSGIDDLNALLQNWAQELDDLDAAFNQNNMILQRNQVRTAARYIRQYLQAFLNAMKVKYKGYQSPSSNWKSWGLN